MSAVLRPDGGRGWRFVADDAPPLPLRWWLLASLRLVDETTGRPPGGALRASAEPAALAVRSAGDGQLAVVGRPWSVCSPLHQAALPLRLAIEAEGFVPRHLELSITIDRRVLSAGAPAGSRVLALDDATGLGPGDVLRVGAPGAPAERATVDAAGPLAQQLTLRGPLVFDHAAGSLAVPERFTPLHLGEVELHRRALVLYGRTLRRGALGPEPVAGATVRIAAVWRRPPPASGGVAPDSASPLALQPPLQADWPVPGSRLALRALPPDGVVAAKRLRADVPAGSRVLPLSDGAGLAAADLLIIDGASPERVEFVAVDAVVSGATPADPADVRLAAALAFAHAADVPVQRADPAPAGPPVPLARSAHAGDCTLLVDGPIGLGAAQEAEVSVAAAAPLPEQHRVAPYLATSDAQGHFRLPPLSRVGQLSLQASAAGLADLEFTLVPDYAEPSSRVDLVFD